MGPNLTFEIGNLHFERPGDPFPLPLPVLVAAIAAGGGILIIIIVIVCIAYRQKSRENERVMKRMQNQMDVLEARVAKECKEGKSSVQFFLCYWIHWSFHYCFENTFETEALLLEL